MIPPRQTHIMLLAGETSGDAHAAAFVAEINRIHPGIKFSGMGGTEMRKAGVDIFFDSALIAVMGLVEVLMHWGDIKKAMRLVKQQLADSKPDLLVLIDYPEFNLKIARYAKSLGIKVLFYISPKIWASRPKRIPKIAESIDHMAVIFKFETEIYQKASIPVTFVGNPLVEKVKASEKADAVRQQLVNNAADRLIGLFPGSRQSEVSRLLPVMLETAKLMKQQDSTLNFVLPVANNLDSQSIQQLCDEYEIEVSITRDKLYDIISSCDAIISCSGTVTLEIGLLKVPVCVLYKFSWLSYQILSRMIIIKHFSLINIIAGRQVVLELLQDAANPQAISQEVFKLLDNKPYRQQVLQGLQEVKSDMGPAGGSTRMAELCLSLLPDTL